MAELNTAPENKGKKVRRSKQALRVDLTAMVDLAFLLITFFILTTTLAKPKIMKVAMPVANAEPEPSGASRSLTICLGADDKAMWYLGTADEPLVSATVTNYGKDGLRRVINNMRQKVRETTGKTMLVLVKPSAKSVYSNLVNTIDELNIAAVDQYSISDADAKDMAMLRDKHVY